MRKCEKCGFTTDDLEQYKQHRVDHALGKVQETLPIPTRPTPIVINPEPEPEEPTVPSKSAKEIMADKPFQRPTKPTPKPIKLRYKYEGQCNKCGGEVETLEIDVDDKYIVSAYCMSCKYQVAHRAVKKL